MKYLAAINALALQALADEEGDISLRPARVGDMSDFLSDDDDLGDELAEYEDVIAPYLN